MEGSRYFQSPYLYKENGFKKKEHAQMLIDQLMVNQPLSCTVEKVERKKENKNPPLLFNLAELQNVCSKLFKISPDETLRIVQELYEKKLVTYPRTDARVSVYSSCQGDIQEYFRPSKLSAGRSCGSRGSGNGILEKHCEDQVCE